MLKTPNKGGGQEGLGAVEEDEAPGGGGVGGRQLRREVEPVGLERGPGPGLEDR